MKKRLSIPFLRRILARLAFGVAAFATLLAVFYGVENWRGRRAWEAYRKEAAEKGRVLDLAAMIPPQVPDEQNFAAVPLIREVFEKGGLPPGAFGKSNPGFMPSSVGDERLFDLSEAQKEYVRNGTLPEAGPSAAEDVLKVLENGVPELEQLELAAERPLSRYPVEWELGVGSRLPHMLLLRIGTQLFTARMAAQLAVGRSDLGYRDCRYVMRLAKSMEKDLSIVSGMVRVAITAMLPNEIWAGLVRGQWADAELEKLSNDLAGIDLLRDYRSSIDNERALSNHLVEQLCRASAKERVELLGGRDPFSKKEYSRLLMLQWMPDGWILQNAVLANRFTDAVLDQIQPEKGRVILDIEPERVAGIDDRARKMDDLIRLRIFPNYERATMRTVWVQTHILLARIAVALTRYRTARGEYPESLQALVPAFLSELPLDILTGEPLRYRREGNEFVLYSTGWNRKDDGGQRVEPNDPKGWRDILKQPDWVWVSSVRQSLD